MAKHTTKHVDVLIVGAGLSGIGAACHLQLQCPKKTYAIVEARATIGGTWDLFRYPGIRSDSDMYTLGYRFKPWINPKAIADGPAILNYIRTTAAEYGVDRKIHFNQKVVQAAWSSQTAQWTVECTHSRTGAPSTFHCRFLMVCSGYYSYENGYTPEFPGSDQFKGIIIHPQHWPKALDYTGKRIVVIGSGATAVTLIPAMARTAGHVTMLQRTPTYMIALPSSDRLAHAVSRLLPEKAAYTLIRLKNMLMAMAFYRLSRSHPELVKRLIKKQLRRALGPHFDIERHFTPPYNPWDQRLCLVPDADFFKALRRKRASIITGHIDTFIPNGIQLKSGAQIKADIIVTATGLDLLALGGILLTVDKKPAQTNRSFVYKGTMLSDIPNLAYVTGYTNASWTLKADLLSAYVCRLIKHMDQHGYRQATPRLRDPAIRVLPLLNLTSGYILRASDRFPHQGTRLPWKLYQNYFFDAVTLRLGRIEDKALEFLM
jgi:monooxygenase